LHFKKFFIMPKAPKSPGQGHRVTLTEEYVGGLKQRTVPRQKRKRTDVEGESFVDDKQSRRILELGRELAEDSEGQPSRPPTIENTAFDFDARIGEDTHDEDEGGETIYEEWEDEGDDEVETEDIDPKDLEAFNKFSSIRDEADDLVWPGESAEPSGQGGTDLAALILEKIRQAEAGNGGDPEVQGGGDPDDAVELPAKVVEVYSKIGIILSRYKSGKLPKPFKILPTLPQWQTLVSVTVSSRVRITVYNCH
jgi:essential nuclear protein 1